MGGPVEGSVSVIAEVLKPEPLQSGLLVREQRLPTIARKLQEGMKTAQAQLPSRSPS